MKYIIAILIGVILLALAACGGGDGSGGGSNDDETQHSAEFERGLKIMSRSRIQYIKINY